MSRRKDIKVISLVLPVELLDKVTISAKAHYVNRADYIRTALLKATKEDEPRVAIESTRHAPE